jgi:hypothetical protein
VKRKKKFRTIIFHLRFFSRLWFVSPITILFPPIISAVLASLQFHVVD